ncbi:hypothetical protein [Escherichia coli]|uniref:hypothetical protein n=1 Tax=Escherichia coli TaxID=562 RepID=UPI000B7E7AE0|nr:hypothetical protein [Escherichia coli]
MNNVFRIFKLLLCLIYVPTAAADYNFSGSSQYVTVNQTFNISDKDAVPGQWIKLDMVNMKTASTVPVETLTDCPGDLLCTGGGISLGYTGQAKYRFYLNRTPITVTDDVGNKYQLTVAFPDGKPVIGVSEFNNMGGKKWDTIASLSAEAGDFTSPKDSQDVLSSPVTKAQGWCGAISGCSSYQIASYPYTTSGMPYIYLKLPSNLSARTISFSNQAVLNMQMEISKKQAGITVESEKVYLYLSGTITVPQRCYIKTNKNNFDFGTVYSNGATGPIGQYTMTLTTDCYYAPDKTMQYLKMEAASGGMLTDDNKTYQIAADSSSQKALGIIFQINGIANCSNNVSTGENSFNQEYLIRTISYQAHNTATDTVNFSLCKYGVPAISEIGQKNIVLKLTSRWVTAS